MTNSVPEEDTVELVGRILQPGVPAFDATVRCRDGIITEVLPTDRNSQSENTHYIVPGLIDVHDHLAFKRTLWESGPQAGALMGTLMHSSSERMREEFAENSARVLRSGVTTVRDFGVDLGASRIAAKQDFLEQPRIISSATPLCITGGHLHHRAREVADKTDVERVLREEIAGDISWVKLFASGGIANFPNDPITVELPTALMETAVRIAHDNGLRIAAHALPSQSVLNAVLSGVDSIEHGVFLTPETADLMAERDVWYVPTLGGYARRVNGLRAAGAYEAADQFERDVIKPHVASVRLAHEAGVRIGVGTDITASVVDEMESLVNLAGLDFHEVMWGATAGAAELLALDDGTGTIAAGARADLVVMKSDPRHCVRTFDDSPSVVRAGRVIS